MSDSTPDLTEFYKYSRPKKPPCKIGVVLGTGSKLKGAEKEQLIAALSCDNSIITAGAVTEWLAKRNVGIDIVPQNVLSHRKGSCTCAREA